MTNSRSLASMSPERNERAERFGPRYTTKSAATYAIVREMIMTNELPAGEAVNQDQLARELGLSVTPLREAFRRLESEGFVTNEPHRGVIVTTLDFERLEKLFVVKVDLECLSTRLACLLATAEQKSGIARLAVPSDTAGPSDRLTDWEANRRFHSAIFHSTGNDFLIEMLESVWVQYDRFAHVFGDVVFSDLTASSEHKQIAEAISDGDADRAEALMRQHHMHTQELTQSASARAIL